jgi:hypothetical protein
MSRTLRHADQFHNRDEFVPHAYRVRHTRRAALGRELNRTNYSDVAEVLSDDEFTNPSASRAISRLLDDLGL